MNEKPIHFLAAHELPDRRELGASYRKRCRRVHIPDDVEYTPKGCRALDR